MDEEITDLVTWRSHVWASTNTGLHRLESGHAEKVAVPPTEKDKITSLYNQSPFALVCGTYKGNLVFISQDDKNYCNVSWELHDPRATSTFYISSITQDQGQIWVGSLEKGVYQVNPMDKSLKNYSLDFTEDTTGINVYDVAKGEKGELWVNSQDGLYFILEYQQGDTSLSYVASTRFRKPFKHMVGTKEGVYSAYKARNGTTKLQLLKFGGQSVEARINKRYRLPDDLKLAGIKAIHVKNKQEFWALGSQLWHYQNKVWTPFDLPESLAEFNLNRLLVMGKNVWVSDPQNGVFLLSQGVEIETQPKPSIPQIQVGVTTELQNVFFQPGDSTLIDLSYRALNSIVVQMQNDHDIAIKVSGHTAKDGDSLFLYNLSIGRARSVKSFLVSQGIDPDRVEVAGLGSTDLKNPSQPKSGENRRVEILMIIR